MDGFHSVAQEDTDVSKEHEPENQATKRRKMPQKTVITYKIKADERKHKNQRPPSDCWSWRKYGQKPIKGSPYPRGYYRCSTSKGCLAKKQVERSRTDASMLVITYTSSHNHPGPDLPTNLTQESKEPQTPVYDDHAKSPNQEPEQKHDQDSLMNSHEDTNEDPSFNNSKEIVITQEENPLAESLENTYDSPNVINQESPLCSHHLMTFSTSKTEGINDFYDELEELPTYSSLSSLTISNFFEARTLVDLS